MTYENNNTTQPPGYGHCTGQPTLDGTCSQELEDFVGAKFYCLHALADGSQRIRIREKTLDFSSTVIYAVSVPSVSISYDFMRTRLKLFQY